MKRQCILLHNHLALRLKKFVIVSYRKCSTSPITYKNSSFQTNALKPALAGMNPKSFPVASPEMHQLHLQKICKSSSQS
jgi:hypothetical protein